MFIFFNHKFQVGVHVGFQPTFIQDLCHFTSNSAVVNNIQVAHTGDMSKKGFTRYSYVPGLKEVYLTSDHISSEVRVLQSGEGRRTRIPESKG